MSASVRTCDREGGRGFPPRSLPGMLHSWPPTLLRPPVSPPQHCQACLPVSPNSQAPPGLSERHEVPAFLLSQLLSALADSSQAAAIPAPRPRAGRVLSGEGRKHHHLQ